MLFEDRWFVWLDWFVAAARAVAILFFQGRWNVYTVPLGRCDVDWHVDRGIVAVACVGRDTIRVWPLGVEQPWWEDDPGSHGPRWRFPRNQLLTGMMLWQKRP
jgi:hypothetical protein